MKRGESLLNDEFRIPLEIREKAILEAIENLELFARYIDAGNKGSYLQSAIISLRFSNRKIPDSYRSRKTKLADCYLWRALTNLELGVQKRQSILGTMPGIVDDLKYALSFIRECLNWGYPLITPTGFDFRVIREDENLFRRIFKLVESFEYLNNVSDNPFSDSELKDCSGEILAQGEPHEKRGKP